MDTFVTGPSASSTLSDARDAATPPRRRVMGNKGEAKGGETREYTTEENDARRSEKNGRLGDRFKNNLSGMKYEAEWP